MVLETFDWSFKIYFFFVCLACDESKSNESSIQERYKYLLMSVYWKMKQVLAFFTTFFWSENITTTTTIFNKKRNSIDKLLSRLFKNKYWLTNEVCPAGLDRIFYHFWTLLQHQWFLNETKEKFCTCRVSKYKENHQEEGKV